MKTEFRAAAGKTGQLMVLGLMSSLGLACSGSDESQAVESSNAELVAGTTVNYEAEVLTRTASYVGSQVTSEAGASGGKYVQLKGTPSVGAWIEFTLPNVAAGTYDLSMLYKSNYNRGIVQATVDGANQGSPCDQYAATAAQQVPCSLGSKTLTAGNHKIRFKVTGKSTASKGYMMVIDLITLRVPVAPGSGGATGSGGSVATGGAVATGGVASTGGAVATGGVASTGGVVATGGVASTGGIGTGGVVDTGGAVGSGGVGGSAAGGGTGTGGAASCSNVELPGAVNIDVTTEYQTVDGFGGASIRSWIADLTTDQINKAFGTGTGQIGLTILRIMVPSSSSGFSAELATPKKVVPMGVKVIATPWTPPPSMKDNNSKIGGHLKTSSYGAYADYLVSFRDYMANNGAPLYAISVQNEPEVTVNYDSCFWDGQQITDFVKAQGSKFGSTRLMAAESAFFDHTLTDGMLNDSAAAAEVDIIAGHIYDNRGLEDYALARAKGKPVWMTEHYTESAHSANDWPLALDVGKELHDSMAANFSAYVWWYIRRSYGLITEDSAVSKRGYLMGQFSKFIRPGAIRVDATAPSAGEVYVTAYKNNGKVVVVAVNMSASAQTVTLNVRNACVGSFARYTTSGSKNIAADPTVPLTDNAAQVTLDAQSVTTFVSN